MIRRETVHSEVSQDEKRATLRNDQRVARGFTYADLAHAEANAPRGRYGAIGKEHVTGVSPVPQYPSQPPGSPWHDQQMPEPPLGEDLSAAPVVGEAFEVQQSIERLERAANDGAGPPPELLSSASLGEVQALRGGPAADVSRRPRRLKPRAR